MEIENLIEKISVKLNDIKKHKADYYYMPVEDVEAILEFLNQLRIIKETEIHRYNKICTNCNKEFIAKRCDTKYCNTCSHKVATKKYRETHREELKEKSKKYMKIHRERKKSDKKWQTKI